MSSLSIKSLIAAATLCAGLLPAAHAGSLVLDLQTGGSATPCGGCGANGTTYGWGFRVSNSIKIDGLGMWDAGANGLGQASVQVGLWDNAGTLLASTFVTDASTQVASASTDGLWLFENISALTLGPGSYRIGAVFLDSTPLAQVGAPFTTIGDVTLTGGIVGAGNAGLSDPLTSFNFPIFGPNLRLADNAVPEPGGLMLVALGLLAAGMQRRRRG